MSAVLHAMPETLPLPLDVPRDAWPALINRAAGELQASTLLDPMPNERLLALSAELRPIAAQLRQPLSVDVPREAWPALIDRAAGELKALKLFDPWWDEQLLALSVELRSIANQVRLQIAGGVR